MGFRSKRRTVSRSPAIVAVCFIPRTNINSNPAVCFAPARVPINCTLCDNPFSSERRNKKQRESPGWEGSNEIEKVALFPGATLIGSLRGGRNANCGLPPSNSTESTVVVSQLPLVMENVLTDVLQLNAANTLSEMPRTNGCPIRSELMLIIMDVSTPNPLKRIFPDPTALAPGINRKLRSTDSPGARTRGRIGPPKSENQLGPPMSIESMMIVSHEPVFRIVMVVSNGLHGGRLSSFSILGNESEWTFGLTVPKSLRTNHCSAPDLLRTRIKRESNLAPSETGTSRTRIRMLSLDPITLLTFGSVTTKPLSVGKMICMIVSGSQEWLIRYVKSSVCSHGKIASYAKAPSASFASMNAFPMPVIGIFVSRFVEASNSKLNFKFETSGVVVCGA